MEQERPTKQRKLESNSDHHKVIEVFKNWLLNGGAKFERIDIRWTEKGFGGFSKQKISSEQTLTMTPLKLILSSIVALDSLLPLFG